MTENKENSNPNETKDIDLLSYDKNPDQSFRL
jgi:hypothetical protein